VSGPRSLLGTAVGAFALDAAACAVAVAAGPAGLALGAALHLAATHLTRRAAALRAPLSRAELDLVTVLACGLPLLGPLTAWCVPRRAEDRCGGDAHEAFEAERARARAAAGVGRARAVELQLTGEPARDLRARLDVECHLDVLRFGDRTLRGNLARKLAERGGPQDLSLLRRVLEDPEEELRIQAFLFLRDARAAHVARVGELRVAAEAVGTAEAWLAAARAHLEFAESGALDPALVRFELERGREALSLGRAAADSAQHRMALGALELALLGRLGRTVEAAEVLRELGRLELLAAEAPHVLEAWAEVALRSGQVGVARAAAEALAVAGAAVPSWLAALQTEARRAG